MVLKYFITILQTNQEQDQCFQSFKSGLGNGHHLTAFSSSELHTTPTSSACEQLWLPTVACWQCSSVLSVPSHSTSSSRIRRLVATRPISPGFATLSALANPSCLHTTVAALMSNRSSHTVPHSPLTKISTRPRSDHFGSGLTSLTFPLRDLLPPPLPLLWPFFLPCPLPLLLGLSVGRDVFREAEVQYTGLVVVLIEAGQYEWVLLEMCGCLVDGRNVVGWGVLRGVVSDLTFKVVIYCGLSVVLWSGCTVPVGDWCLLRTVGFVISGLKVGFGAGICGFCVGFLDFWVGALNFGFWVRILGEAVVCFLGVAWTMVVLGLVVALVLGEAVVVGFLLITNSVKEDQEMILNSNPQFLLHRLIWLMLLSKLIDNWDWIQLSNLTSLLIVALSLNQFPRLI